MKKQNLLLFLFVITIFSCYIENKETDTSSSSLRLNSSSSIKSGVKDSIKHGGKFYKTVIIGSQTWFAENLNVEPNEGNSWCYGDINAYCNDYGYGRLYDWKAAMTVCPPGWKLPSKADFDDLWDYVKEKSGEDYIGRELKSKRGDWKTGVGLDTYGFSALPGGYRGETDFIGGSAYWWASSPENDCCAHYRSITGNSLESSNYKKTYGLSVRCIKK